MESWNETTGSNARDVLNMDETGCFWRGFLKEPYTPREDGALEGKSEATTNMRILCKCGREKEYPVVIVTSVSPRCFKNLQSPSRPCIQLLLFRQ